MSFGPFLEAVLQQGPAAGWSTPAGGVLDWKDTEQGLGSKII